MFMIEYRYFPEIYSINGMDLVRNKVPIGTLAGSKDIKYIFFWMCTFLKVFDKLIFTTLKGFTFSCTKNNKFSCSFACIVKEM